MLAGNIRAAFSLLLLEMFKELSFNYAPLCLIEFTSYYKNLYCNGYCLCPHSERDFVPVQHYTQVQSPIK